MVVRVQSELASGLICGVEDAPADPEQAAVTKTMSARAAIERARIEIDFMSCLSLTSGARHAP